LWQNYELLVILKFLIKSKPFWASIKILKKSIVGQRIFEISFTTLVSSILIQIRCFCWERNNLLQQMILFLSVAMKLFPPWDEFSPLWMIFCFYGWYSSLICENIKKKKCCDREISLCNQRIYLAAAANLLSLLGEFLLLCGEFLLSREEDIERRISSVIKNTFLGTILISEKNVIHKRRNSSHRENNFAAADKKNTSSAED
jgi:hypothetical protein